MRITKLTAVPPRPNATEQAWLLAIEIVNGTSAHSLGPLFGHWALMPLKGTGDSHPLIGRAQLAPGATIHLSLTFHLPRGAAPAFAMFEDDDFPLCFRVGPLRPGRQKGVHPLSALEMNLPG